LYQAAKSHKHYTHLTNTGCKIGKVFGDGTGSITMEVVEWIS